MNSFDVQRPAVHSAMLNFTEKSGHNISLFLTGEQQNHPLQQILGKKS